MSTKNFDPINDISTTYETEGTSKDYLCSGSLTEEAYKSAYILYDGYTPILSIEYGESVNSSYQATALNAAIKRATYKKYASMVLDNPDATLLINNNVIDEAFFITVYRNEKKSELRKYYNNITLINDTGYLPGITLMDSGDTKYYRNLNSEYNEMHYLSGSSDLYRASVFYQPAIYLIDPKRLFANNQTWTATTNWYSTFDISNLDDVLLGANGTWANIILGFFYRLREISFQNQLITFYTNYFCKAGSKEFNYSANPTFVSGTNREIVVIDTTDMYAATPSHTYITGMGLYDNSDNLLAVAKINKPIRKDFSIERVFKVRLAQ